MIQQLFPDVKRHRCGTNGFQKTQDKENCMKKIIISVAGTDGSREHKDVEILPGTKARDILDQLKLQGFQLNKPEGGAFGFNDDLYQAVSEGQKVFATKSDVVAGGTLVLSSHG